MTYEKELKFFRSILNNYRIHSCIITENELINNLCCTDTVTCYTDKEGNLKFLKYPQHKVYKYELQESQGASAPQFHNPYDNGVNFEDLSSDDSSLPF